MSSHRRLRRGLAAVVAVVLGLSACVSDDPTVATPPAPSAPATPDSGVGLATDETVEVTLWISPDRTRSFVRFTIDDPIATNTSSMQLAGDVLKTASSLTVHVDGQPREVRGLGLVPWEFGVDRRLEVEMAAPVTPSGDWILEGQMLTDWLPRRAGVPRYFSKVVWDIEVHGPIDAAIGGDPAACRRPAPGGREADRCVATREIGVPPLIYLPADGEPVRRSADGYVELIGDLPDAVAEDLLAFADDAVRRLNEILGDVAPRRVEVVTGDVLGNFAGQALGPMVVLDRAYVTRAPGEARELLAHELVHTAQEHRLAAPGRDPGSGMTESLAEYVGARLRYEDDLGLIRDRVRNRRVANASTSDVEGLAPRDAFLRRPPIGEDELQITYAYEARALIYTYLPRAWIEVHELLGDAQMDRFLRELHTREDLDWNIDRVFELADEFDPEAGEILRRYWEEPIPRDQEDW